nr:HAMP domain-containing sensor histidine kinase [Streptomyces sp. HNM0574]
MRTRLAVVTSAAVALVVVLTSLAAFLAVRHELGRQLDRNLASEAARVRAQAKDPEAWWPSGSCRYAGGPACIQAVDADGDVVTEGDETLPVDEGARQVASGRRGAYYRDITLFGRPVRLLTAPIPHDRAVQIGLRSDPADRALLRVGAVLLVVSVGGVLLAGLLGWAIARHGLRPVGRLTATAERIAATRDASTPIEVTGADELARLAASFNTMLAELDASVTAQRRLVADASHELRTPLTSLRTNIAVLARADRISEAQRDRALDALDRELTEMTGLVRDLVDLARGEEPAALLEDVPLVPLTAHCVRTAERHWPDVTFHLHTPADGSGSATGPVSGSASGPVEAAVVSGLPARLERLIGNLLDNAAKFSPDGGAVEVAVSEEPGDWIELTVRDHGPGIADEDLPHLFDRFYRSRSARALPGSGLGLAMARQIALSHGATLTAANHPAGGAHFTLRIPSAV